MTQDQSNICHFSGQIQLISGGPSAAYLADRPRLHSGHIIGVTEAYRCIWRTVRGPWADCPCCNFLLIRASGEKLHEWRTVRLLPADRPLYQISDSPEFCQLSQFQFWIGIIAQITFQKNLKTSMDTIQRLIWVSKNEKSKINQVKSRKLVNSPLKLWKIKKIWSKECT